MRKGKIKKEKNKKVKKARKAQISLEYIIVLSFLILVVSAGIALSYLYLGRTKTQIAINTINEIGNKIVSEAELIYFLGEPARTTISVYFPKNINAVIFKPSEKEIIFNVTTTKGMKVQLVYSSKVPINGTITKPEGRKTLLIKAEKTATGLIVKVEER